MSQNTLILRELNWLMVVTEIIFQQVDKITKQMQLEAQLADARLTKAKMEMAAEKEVLLKEKQQLLMVTDILLEVEEVPSTWFVSSAFHVCMCMCVCGPIDKGTESVSEEGTPLMIE
jgi:hypothetical protein